MANLLLECLKLTVNLVYIFLVMLISWDFSITCRKFQTQHVSVMLSALHYAVKRIYQMRRPQFARLINEIDS